MCVCVCVCVSGPNVCDVMCLIGATPLNRLNRESGSKNPSYLVNSDQRSNSHTRCICPNYKTRLLQPPLFFVCLLQLLSIRNSKLEFDSIWVGLVWFVIVERLLCFRLFSRVHLRLESFHTVIKRFHQSQRHT